jgi:CubicO group peptidase (beta-lactamase class C family)
VISCRTRVRAVWTCATLFTLGARALGAQPAEYVRLLDSTRRAASMPAMAAAVFTRDSVIFFDAQGIRRLKDPTPVTRDDRFNIGSNTKAMTAGLVALLVDDGKLTWTATLAELFPEYATRMRPEYRDVTLRDLLTHHGGLVRDASGTFGQTTGRAQRERFAEWVLTQRPASPRGTFAYSNAGYILLGAIVERITGADFETLLVQRLLAPLGLTTVGYGPPATPGTVDQPWGHTDYALRGLKARPPGDNDSDFAPLYTPAGRVNLSIHDFASWAQTILRASSGGTSPWKAETVREMLTPPVPADSMAMGWWAQTRAWAGPSRRILVHDGGNKMFFSLALLVPDLDFGVVVAINRGDKTAGAALATLVNRLVDVRTGRKR